MEDSDQTDANSSASLNFRKSNMQEQMDRHLTAAGIDLKTLTSHFPLNSITVGCLLAIQQKCGSPKKTWVAINSLFSTTYEGEENRLRKFRRLLQVKGSKKKGDVGWDEILTTTDLAIERRQSTTAINNGNDPSARLPGSDNVQQDSKSLKNEIQNLVRRLKRAKIRIQKLTQVNRRIVRSQRGDKQRATVLSNVRARNRLLQLSIGRLRKQSYDKSALIISKNQYIAELECIQEKREPTNVEIFDGGKYSDAVVECVLKLQSYSVADDKIPLVLQAVSSLVNVRLDRMPSPSTCRSFAVAGLHLARTHIGEQLQAVLDTSGNVCLQSDETTKGKHKLQAYGAGLRTEHGQETVFLGLCKVADKSADTAFEMLKRRLSQLNKADNFVDRVLGASSCAMSDRASTQAKLNTLVKAYRDNILPTVVSDWDSLSPTQQLSQREFSEFYCQLHVISNLTDVVLEALAQFERLHTGQNLPKAQPTVISVIRETERYFGECSCGMHGIFPRWEAWCMNKGIKHFALPSFYGHRWNIVFLLAARIVYLLPHITTFIDECCSDKPELNELTSWLSDSLVVSHLRILGLVDQKVTGPLWRLCEHSEHILETCSYATCLIEWLQRTISDPVDFFSTVIPVVSSTPNDKITGSLLNALVQLPTKENCLKCVLLVLTACDKYLSSVFVDYLPNGKYYGRDEFMDRTSCAPASNRAIESFFGLVTHIHSFSPNMALTRLESVALMKKNHTMEWLADQPAHFRATLIREARQSISKCREESNEEMEEVLSEILRKARAKKAKKEEKDASDMKARARLTESILVWGFWRTSKDIDVGLQSVHSVLKQRTALTSQIRFRQKVMQQPEPRAGLYVLTVNKSPCSITELKTRLLELFEHDKKIVSVLTGVDSLNLPGRTILHRFKDNDGVYSEFEGFVESVERRGTGQPMAMINYSGYSVLHSVSLAELEMGLSNGDVVFLDPE